MSNLEEKGMTPPHTTSTQTEQRLTYPHTQGFPIDEQHVVACSETRSHPFTCHEVEQTDSQPSLCVAIYTRGTDHFEQLSHCLDYARGHGYALDEIRVYCETVGHSGIADPHDSAAITLLLQAAQRQEFSVLLVTDSHRLSRKRIDLAQLLDELHSYRVQVLAINEPVFVPNLPEAERIHTFFKHFLTTGEASHE